MSITSRRRIYKVLIMGAFMWQLIPFGCGGQTILRLVSPILLDDTYNILDTIVRAVSPLVLP